MSIYNGNRKRSWCLFPFIKIEMQRYFTIKLIDCYFAKINICWYSKVLKNVVHYTWHCSLKLEKIGHKWVAYKVFGWLTGYIINNHRNGRVPDVAWNKAPKSLLSCSIPDSKNNEMLTVLQENITWTNKATETQIGHANHSKLRCSH